MNNSMTYAVMLKYADQSGRFYRWLPLAAEKVAINQGTVTGYFGFTHDASEALAVASVEEGYAVVREYRRHYGEHADLTVITNDPGRVAAMIDRVWHVEHDPAHAAKIDGAWTRWKSRHPNPESPFWPTGRASTGA